MKAVFTLASKIAPSVVFVDEVRSYLSHQYINSFLLGSFASFFPFFNDYVCL